MKKTLFAISFVLVFQSTAFAYSDTSDTMFENSINFLSTRGVVSGYSDGTFKPGYNINRAELLKILIGAAAKNGVWNLSTLDQYGTENCFTDVPANQWYTKYVCFAKANNIISGYPDGSFKPDQEIIFAEAGKIALTSYKISYTQTPVWYEGIMTAIDQNDLFDWLPVPDLKVQRDHMAEIATRLILKEEGVLQDYIYDNNFILTYTASSNIGTSPQTNTTDTTTDSTDTTDTTPPATTQNYDTVIANETLNDGYYEYSTAKFIYKIDSSLAADSTIRKNYMKKYISLNEQSYSFLKDYLGFEPKVNKITITSRSCSNSGSGTTKNEIFNCLTENISQTEVNNLTYGNAHELSHIFFYYQSTMEDYYQDTYMMGRGYVYIMEGLADYLEDYEQYGDSGWGLLCSDSGWAEGYLDVNETPIYNSEIVPYYDFSTQFPDNTKGIYYQNSSTGGYKSGECFWIYLKDKYGHSKVKSILPAMDKKLNVDAIHYFTMVEDIIDPLVSEDLTQFVLDRYNYTESLPQ